MTASKRMQQKRTKEFKEAAAKKVVERGEAQAAVARNLGVTAGQIYCWSDRRAPPEVTDSKTYQIFLPHHLHPVNL